MCIYDITGHSFVEVIIIITLLYIYLYDMLLGKKKLKIDDIVPQKLLLKKYQIYIESKFFEFLNHNLSNMYAFHQYYKHFLVIL